MNYVRFPDVFFVTRRVGFGIHFEEATNAFVTFMTCAIHATLLIVKPPKCGKSVGGLDGNHSTLRFWPAGDLSYFNDLYNSRDLNPTEPMNHGCGSRRE